MNEYEYEVIDNISELFEEKVDLEFDLPVKISFIERFEIAINRKILSLIETISFSSFVNPNWINLFKNELDDLKFSEKNPNFFETLKLKSSVDFNLIGIGLPKIADIENNEIEVKIYEGNVLLGEVVRFENFDHLSVGYFKSTDSDLTDFIEVESDTEYSIVI